MRSRIPNSLEELPVSEIRWIGKGVERLEDPSLVTGRTEFIDNVVLPGMLHCAILRSPYAHARIVSIDSSAAEEMEGVYAVITGRDAARLTNPATTAPEGWGAYCLAHEKTRFVGEPVVAVAATSRYLAEDALELIIVEYEELPVVANAQAALADDAALIFEEHGSNVMFARKFTWGEVAAAFADADLVVADDYHWNRLGANPMETFGCVVDWNPADDMLTCRGSFQSQSHMGLARSLVLGLPSNRVRMISHPHGGSFGGKGGFRGVDICALLSKAADGRPVKWIEDRLEYLLAGAGQSWDREYTLELALKNDGTVTGLRVKLLDDMGGTAEGFGAVSAAKPLAAFTGCYAIRAAEYDLALVATNKVPQSPYRGMGPPPHNWVLEQTMDKAARELGLDPAEIRRRNYIPADAFPYTIASGNEYDSGNYEAALDALLDMADYQKLCAERELARADGRLVGLGLVNTVEPGVFDWNAYAIVGMESTGVPEGITVAVDVMGRITARLGFSLEGQGQYTLVAQVLADYFAVTPADVSIVYQDSLSAPPHFGPGGSRLGVAITGAALGAAFLLERKLAQVAAVLLQCEPDDVEFMDGFLRLRAMPEAKVHFAEVAGAMLARSDLLPEDSDPQPQATYVWTAPGRTPADEQGRAKSYLTAANACHLVKVEVDRDTGTVDILGYWLVDDCGTRLNPVTVEGQTMGGIAQGVGAALLEEYVYDESAQPLTSTFMDYLLPSVYEVPRVEKKALTTPSPFTPLGAKGCGEGAMHTTPAAIMCAINDALSPLGLSAREVPASPRRLWKLLHENDRQD